MLVDSRVRAALAQNYVSVELFTDEADSTLARKNILLQQELGRSQTLPLYVILNPKTGAVLDRFGYTRGFLTDPGSFAKRLLDSTR